MSGAEFWRGRRVFLTGHTGFKGSWLSLLLSDWGAEVHGFALAPEAPAMFDRVGAAGLVASSTLGDVRDPVAVDAALAASGAEVVIHMAAQPLVRASYDDPVGTYAVNVMGTVHLLEAVRRRDGAGATVVVTTDKCYENREWVWGYREDEPMGGYDPYSNSKGCAELVVSAYRRSYGQGPCAALASARAGNVIGGGDWSRDRLIPDLIRNFLAGEETPIRNPAAVRPWQHVLEPLTGYLALAEHLLSGEGERYAEGWNFGPDAEAERTVGDVVSAACRRWGEGARWRHDRGEQVHEAGYLKLDSSKARRYLGWRPVWSFEESVARTVDWYQADARGLDMLAFTRKQVAEYAAAHASQLGRPA